MTAEYPQCGPPTMHHHGLTGNTKPWHTHSPMAGGLLQTSTICCSSKWERKGPRQTVMGQVIRSSNPTVTVIPWLMNNVNMTSHHFKVAFQSPFVSCCCHWVIKTLSQLICVRRFCCSRSECQRSSASPSITRTERMRLDQVWSKLTIPQLILIEILIGAQRGICRQLHLSKTIRSGNSNK